MNRLIKVVLPLALFALSACTVNLQHDLNEDDANDIYVLLIKKGIDATKIKEGEGKEARYVIAVPKADVADAARLLREHSLPRTRADGLAIFKMTKGMIPTATEERAMFIEALGGEVSNALNRVPGILEARCIVMIPEVNDLTQPEKKPMPTASVLLKYTNIDGKPPIGETDVREFVARAVPELKPEAVKVLMTEAKFLTEDNSEEVRTQSLLGMKVDKASAGTLKTLVGSLAVLILLMAAALVFLVLRKPAASNGSSKSRIMKAQPPPE